MRKISKIEPVVTALPKRKKVAAYARVSMETDRLAHSLSAQVSYYSELIQKNPEWEYAGVYADSFISGTSTKNRTEFQRLIADCDAGLIDIVLCKSISRFARNTVDLLETVRHLKDIGVEVRFEKENINSLSSDGELMLTLLAGFAQEESRSISENSKWGIRKRFQNGTIGTANKHILGYRYDDKLQKYVIIPDEAKTVKWMFQMYIDGVSLREIADRMNKAGIRTILGNEFQKASVRQMIFNEVYAGDTRRQKTHTPDPITKHKIRNDGELPQYLMTDSHEAIIDRDMYSKVQAEMKRRTAMLNPVYTFTGKIKCGCCGSTYTRKKGMKKGKIYVHWICRAKKEKNITCNNVNFSEQELKNICTCLLGLSEFDEEQFESSVKNIIITENGDAQLNLIGGEVRIWKNLHLNPLHHIKTSTDAFLNKIRCRKCGEAYHRNCGANWVYWYCYGKNNKTCNNINYTDYQLRQISAYILGISAFDEQIFTEQINIVSVLEDGSLEFIFKDGRTVKWQRV